jgi:peptidoglycan hydrolase-like protein with peptidoglycan-binding domain
MNMKIKYISILPVIAVFALSSISLTLAQTNSSSYTFTQNLTIGSSGADVIALQQLLINDGYLTSVSTPTGYFGYGTQAALAKFQAANGISPATGYCGAKTRAFLNTLDVSSINQPTSAIGNQQSQPVTESNNQICQNQYGENSDYTGTNNSQGGLICGCNSGYQWNSSQTACVALPVETGYQVCSNEFPNGTWNGTYGSNGKYNCVCDSGYVMNSADTGCVVSNQATTPPPNTSSCNGTNYNACPAGDDFICPASGEAYCQPGQQQKLASLESALQSWQNQETPIDNQIAQIQNQANQCMSSLSPNLSEAGGEQGLQQNEQAAICTSLEQELNNTIAELTPIRNQEAYIEQEINQVENTQ